MGNIQKAGNLTAKNRAFAELVVSGVSQAEAYRRVYNKPNVSPPHAAHKGCIIATRPIVAAEIARLRAKSGAKKILSLNDRLEILAQIAQDPDASGHEKSRAIEVYSKISGDQAPQRHEHTGPEGAPIPVAASVQVGRLSVRDKIAAFRAKRAAETPPANS